MHISAVHEPVLSGNVPGLCGKQEYRHTCNLLWLSHARAQGNLGNDLLELVFVGGDRGDVPPELQVTTERDIRSFPME